MNIRKTFKYRLKPPRKLLERFAQFAGCCRYVYNFGLAAKKSSYEKQKRSLSSYDLNNLLPRLKQEEDTAWLKDVHSQILQQSLNDLNLAFQHFFRGVKEGQNSGYPKFKKKGDRDSFRYPQGVKVDGNQVYLPKMGWIRFKKSREIEGVIKQTTVLQEAGKWYVCFSCAIEKADQDMLVSEETAIGIDLGLASYATISQSNDGGIVEVENPQFLKKGLKKEQYLNRALSKKEFRSQNWQKAKRRLQVFKSKQKNRRKDFAHKLSTTLVKNHDIVGVESLSIKDLLQDRVSSLARSIADAGWRQFLECLRYKLEYAGKVLVEASRWFASTKMCSCCQKKHEIPLSVRIFRCDCGYEAGRDENAAINLRNLALKNYKAAGTTV